MNNRKREICTVEQMPYTVRRRQLSSITRAPCRKVIGVPGQR